MARKLPPMLVAIVLMSGSFIPFAMADEGPGIKGDDQSSGINVDVSAKKPVISLDTTRPPRSPNVAMRARQLEGIAVRNESDKLLGEVRDVVLDTEEGRVKYVAVAFGGFLGVGTKLFAIPFEAFTFDPASDGRDACLRVALSEKTLRKAPGFNPEHWPDMASPEFESAIQKHYGNDQVNVNVGPVHVHVDTKATPEATNATPSKFIRRASDVISTAVLARDEKIGTIDDLMIDMPTGKIRYAALSVGGFDGLDTSLFALPWDAIHWKHDSQTDTDHFYLMIDPQIIKNSKGFDQDHWPQQANPKFDPQADNGINRRPYIENVQHER
ncbi:hypothetical protein GC197_11190 [bacterium]|nr:hypothetical protein [bacterium]